MYLGPDGALETHFIAEHLGGHGGPYDGPVGNDFQDVGGGSIGVHLYAQCLDDEWSDEWGGEWAGGRRMEESNRVKRNGVNRVNG